VNFHDDRFPLKLEVDDSDLAKIIADHDSSALFLQLPEKQRIVKTVLVKTISGAHR
jgi:hypothetical protein